VINFNLDPDESHIYTMRSESSLNPEVIGTTPYYELDDDQLRHLNFDMYRILSVAIAQVPPNTSMIAAIAGVAMYRTDLLQREGYSSNPYAGIAREARMALAEIASDTH